MNSHRRLLVLALAIAWSPLALPAQAGPSARTIAITARKYEFTPKEVHLKVGETVTLQFQTADRKHGISCRGLKLDEDILPGQTAEAVVTPGQAGTFPAVCSHFCGLGHKGMKMTFVVDP